jgi:hypothetical protein
MDSLLWYLFFYCRPQALYETKTPSEFIQWQGCLQIKTQYMLEKYGYDQFEPTSNNRRSFQTHLVRPTPQSRNFKSYFLAAAFGEMNN